MWRFAVGVDLSFFSSNLLFQLLKYEWDETKDPFFLTNLIVGSDFMRIFNTFRNEIYIKLFGSGALCVS